MTQVEYDLLASLQADWRPIWCIETPEARDRVARLRVYESSDTPPTVEGIALDWVV